MRIYIASSWKNQHAVEMLTAHLRGMGHEVLSFVENNHDEGHGADKPVPFEDWVLTEKAEQSFRYDTDGATKSDLVIYLSPSGTDAWAEVGAAWASGVMIYGLWAKGEPSGLMRKMMTAWFHNYQKLLASIPLANARVEKGPQCDCGNKNTEVVRSFYQEANASAGRPMLEGDEIYCPECRRVFYG